MNVNHPTLYQVDSKGQLRYWFMQTEGGKHRTVSGVVGGKDVVSGWVVSEPKNVGKSNATTAEEQALLETQADYKLKRDKKYYDSIDEAKKAGSGTKFLSPMLAQKWEDNKAKAIANNSVFFVQPKLDGIRATISKNGILSRAGKPIVSVPHISNSLGEFFHQNPRVIALDGELYNHDLKHDFDKITSLVKKEKPSPQDLKESEDLIQFHCYDVIMDGNFEDRIRFRDTYLDQHWCIKHVETLRVITEAEIDELHAEFIGEGYEGSMIRLNTPYESKRSKGLMKRKDFFDSEFEIAEFVEGKGDWTGAVKAVKFRMPDGRVQDDGGLPEAGCRGSREFLTKLWEDYISQAVRAEIGWGIIKRDLPTHATIRYPNLTPRGFPRFGVVTDWHYGKREY